MLPPRCFFAGNAMVAKVSKELIDAAHFVAASENEAEIVQKLLNPLLATLGFGDEDLVPEKYIKQANVGKGKSARQGYKPDQLIRLEGYIVGVVEAKHSLVNVMDGWREAHAYATYLNREEPWSNAIHFVVACNGRELAIGTKDSRDSDVLILNVAQALTHVQMWSDVERELSRETMAAYAVDVRLAAGRQDASSPRALIFQGGRIPRDTLNPIASALKQLLDRYFVELVQLTDDDFEFAFCDPTKGGRRREIENVSRDRAPGLSHASQLTRDNIESDVGSILRRFHEENVNGRTPVQADRFVLVLGDPGAGKSTLLDWYRRFSEDNEKVCFIRFDGTRGPQEASDLYEHLLKTAIQQAEQFYLDLVKPKEPHEAIRELMQPRWRKEYDELYRDVGQAQYFKDRFPKLVHELRSDRAEYFNVVLDGLRRRGCSVCVILDNLDQTNVVKQVEGFRTLRPFAEQFAVCCIMALREETYRLHENSEPFNAFHKSPVFHVPAPTAVSVIEKRLELLKQKYGQSNLSLGAYKLGDLKVEVSQKSVVRCLAAIFEQLRIGEDDLSLIDGVCGHDMRKALEPFSKTPK